MLSAPEDVLVYEYDYGLDRHPPDLVVFPRSTTEVATAVRLAAEAGVPVVARGAGTGIAGGSIPIRGGLIVSLTRMNRILEIDAANRRALVEPAGRLEDGLLDERIVSLGKPCDQAIDDPRIVQRLEHACGAGHQPGSGRVERRETSID